MDILFALKGEDSYGAGFWSPASSVVLPQPPYFSGGQRRVLLLGYPPMGPYFWGEDSGRFRHIEVERVTKDLSLVGMGSLCFIEALDVGGDGVFSYGLSFEERHPWVTPQGTTGTMAAAIPAVRAERRYSSIIFAEGSRGANLR